MSRISRRSFVQGAAAAGAALALPIRNVLGANEKVRIASIGLGGRGSGSAGWFSKIPGVEIVWLCEPDSKRLAAAKKRYPNAQADADCRKALEDKNVDAVVISSASHQHALQAVWACQAGKDVYVEKPVSHTVWEGRQIVEAARKNNRIVQGGTQQRSDPVQEKIREFIKSGKLGKMQHIRGMRYGYRPSIGKRSEPLTPPAEVNYDVWLGPAQDLPMYRKQFHYDWHWIWNTGSGEMGNWGVHVLDDIRNMLDDRCSLPKRILAAGGRVGLKDDAGETPNMHVVYFDTGIVPVIFDLCGLYSKPDKKTEPAFKGVRSGYVIQFENGYYAGGRGGGKAYDKDGNSIAQFRGDAGGGHAQNFIDAVRSRDRKSLNAEIEQTHYTSSWCHLANVAYRLGSQYKKEQVLDIAKDFKPWQELIDGFQANLEVNGVQLDAATMQSSAILEIDPAKEVFTGPSDTPKAQALLTREYRKGYEMPKV
ncbi:MAG: Inositol 2-dehydrogenase [Planctomycetes bacterium ADurb.Bin126]|nr:MAG: Inositol 2-dehydrogenase [Planctomycetes bacterium ADurb.Bin126]HOD82423.1 Gfo/Idh/MocA family oxidoreductase [Phycisphaerae bacterium]